MFYELGYNGEGLGEDFYFETEELAQLTIDAVQGFVMSIMPTISTEIFNYKDGFFILEHEDDYKGKHGI